tara:strand:- start:105 stop:938 length:834 start_codon:yes stop_codon:yes gene_type:complete
MKFLPSIKILVLNWNGESIISKCLNSVSLIEYDNYTVDIIDNGSTDDSLKIIKNNYPKFNIISINKNLGYAKGYNYAFDKLIDEDFDYYLLLNNDTIVNKSLLNDLSYNLIKYGENNIYSPKIINSKNNRLWFAGGYCNKYLGVTIHRGINEIENNIFYKTSESDYVPGCCMLIQKNLIDKLSGFNEIYKMYYEDVDLCYRAIEFSSECFVIEENTILHDVSSSIGYNSFKKYLLKFSSQIKFIYSNNNMFVFLISFLFNLLFLPIYCLIFLYKRLV